LLTNSVSSQNFTKPDISPIKNLPTQSDVSLGTPALSHRRYQKKNNKSLVAYHRRYLNKPLSERKAVACMPFSSFSE
jgi:hypothetical protein